jgi:hypothetical protein
MTIEQLKKTCSKTYKSKPLYNKYCKQFENQENKSLLPIVTSTKSKSTGKS